MKDEYRFEVYVSNLSGKKEFVVQYYDFDEVIGVGETIEEAIGEAQSNLDFHLKFCKDNNIKIPSPSVHEEVDYSGKVTLRMSKNLHKLVDERAQKEGVSINSLLNEAVYSYISEKNIIDKLMADIVNDVCDYTKEIFDEYLVVYNNRDINNNVSMNGFNSNMGKMSC